jgi:hypothetical protein
MANTARSIAVQQQAGLGTASSPASAKLLMATLAGFAALFPLLHLAFGGLNYWLHMLLFISMNIADHRDPPFEPVRGEPVGGPRLRRTAPQRPEASACGTARAAAPLHCPPNIL